MFVILGFIIIGFGIGFYTGLPYSMLPGKYQALLFLAILDSLTFGLTCNIIEKKSANHLVFIRFLTSLIFGAFIIYFGEKSELDLYLVALIPLGVGFALNLYKFLPK